MAKSILISISIISFLAVAVYAITPNTACFAKAKKTICQESFESDFYFCLNNSRVVYDHVSKYFFSLKRNAFSQLLEIKYFKEVETLSLV